jgi:hypothetical protein
VSAQDTGGSAGPAKRHAPALLTKRGPLLTFLALALVLAVVLAVAVTATIARWPAHAAETSPEDAAAWHPGLVTYQYDPSGCHTIQQASIDAATTDVADTVSAVLDTNKVKDDFSQDAGVKMTKIDDVRKNGTHIDLTIHGWLSNAACEASGSAQQASLLSGSGADATRGTFVLGTLDLTRPHQMSAAAGTSWYKEALKVAVAAVAMVALIGVTAAVIWNAIIAGSSVGALVLTGALAGCISSAVAHLVLARLFDPEATATAKDRIAVASEGCMLGARLGGVSGLAGKNVAAGVRRHLSSDEGIVGQSGLAAAKAAGVTMDNRLASMVDGVAEGALRATQ